MKKMIKMKKPSGTILDTDCGQDEYLRNYCNYVSKVMNSIDRETIDDVIDCFLRAWQSGVTIFFAGNGGSAATASHFAQDLGAVGRKTGTKCFRAICINDNISSITALGNDYGYEKIFTGQLSNLFKKGDVLVAISASGNSPNIVEAVKLAKSKGGVTVGFVGFDGGKVAKLCRYVVHATTEKGEYGPVEDVHLILNHMITSYLMNYMRRKNGKKAKRIC